MHASIWHSFNFLHDNRDKKKDKKREIGFEERIRKSRPLVQHLYREIKSWLSGRDETKAEIECLQSSMREVHQIAADMRRVIAKTALTVVVGLSRLGLAASVVTAAGTIALIVSRVIEKCVGGGGGGIF